MPANSSWSPGRLLARWGDDRRTPPLGVAMNSGQASPADDKLLLAAKWNTTYPPSPGSNQGGSSPSNARKILVAKLHEEYELALNLSLNEQREVARSPGDVERRPVLVAKWKGEHLGGPTVPSSTAPTRGAGHRKMAADSRTAEGGDMFIGSTRLEQTREESSWRPRIETEASGDDKIVKSLFFIE